MPVAPRVASVSLSDPPAGRVMRQCTLPRTARLLKPGDFAALRTASRRLNARHFIAEFAPNNRAGCRLGQAVSRRVSKRAVDRNRIKRLVRDSYAMPEVEYAQIAMLKKRLAALGREARKSELLRGGIAALAAFNDDELKAVMGRIERIKTGRPAKK